MAQKKCPLWSIPCNDGDGCYGVEDLCNGEAKCKDGTDEIFMVSYIRSPDTFRDQIGEHSVCEKHFASEHLS